MKTTRLIKIDWKNTDWSVSQFDAKTEFAPRPHSLEAALERARHEADAIAWTTPYPLLVLPLLREEKEAQARAYWEKQRGIFDRSEKIIHALFPKNREQAAA